MTPFPAPPALSRRSALRALLLPLAAALGMAAQAQTPAFGFEQLARLAQQRAQAPHRAERARLPAELAALDYDQVRDIRWRPERALWRDLGLPYEAMFFHLGLYQTEPVRLHEITPEGVRPLDYRAQDFDYGRNTVDPRAWGDLGFAGFRLHHVLNNPAYKDELVVFQGASYFRALGAGQQYGLSARALAIDTMGAKPGQGEEFPRFTEFWLQRPTPGAPGAPGNGPAVVYALLESPRATGAWRFEIHPGPQTTMRVQARLFLREGAGGPIATLGLAPLTSMYFFGENQPRADDFRPEVHDSDGLMVATGEGEWIWRPLQNPGRALVTSFATRNPRGFGLMQRDRRWSSYEDLEARYERRPSAWIRPLGDWGPGRVELVQLPTPDETEDNIVAYWVPDTQPAPGAPLDFAYELLWQGDEPQRPPGAWVVQTRMGHGFHRRDEQARRGQVQYVIDFAGPALAALPPGAPVRAVVSSDANGRVLEPLVYLNPVTGHWRLTLRVLRIDPNRPVELRAFLQHQNHTLSETWSHILP